MAANTRPCKLCGQPKRAGRGVHYCDACTIDGNPSDRPEVQRNRQLKYRFGITAEQYDEMLAAQGGRCAVCGEADLTGNNLAVDHDHSCCAGTKACGECVRGLLCQRCNTALGLLRDDTKLLESAIRYLNSTDFPTGQ